MIFEELIFGEKFPNREIVELDRYTVARNRSDGFSECFAVIIDYSCPQEFEQHAYRIKSYEF